MPKFESKRTFFVKIFYNNNVGRRMREKRDQFIKFMEECNVSTKMTYTEFSNKYGKDDRFKGIDKSRERESLFNEHILDLRRREKEERQAKREQVKAAERLGGFLGQVQSRVARFFGEKYIPKDYKMYQRTTKCIK
jgi:hypothetical protein